MLGITDELNSPLSCCHMIGSLLLQSSIQLRACCHAGGLLLESITWLSSAPRNASLALQCSLERVTESSIAHCSDWLEGQLTHRKMLINYQLVAISSSSWLCIMLGPQVRQGINCCNRGRQTYDEKLIKDRTMISWVRCHRHASKLSQPSPDVKVAGTMSLSTRSTLYHVESQEKHLATCVSQTACLAIVHPSHP